MERPSAEDPPSFASESIALASLVDPTLSGPDVTDLDPARLSSLLQANKLSRAYLPPGREDPSGAARDETHLAARAERGESVCDRLNEADVAYASMKDLRTPKAMMSDVDLLVPDPSEHARACRVLADDGFDFYRFRLLAHPRKVMAKQSMDDPRPVDLYPDAMWIRKVVCDGEAVVARADTDGRRRPAPADDLYLVATHAFSHLSVTFAELYHGVRVVDEAEDLDWSTALDAAESYGCFDALAAYLLLLDEYLRATDRERIPRSVFEAIPETVAVRLVRRWWSNGTPRAFPVRFPTWLPTVVSSAHHVPRVARRLSVRESVKDLQSHYLTAASQLVLGKA